MRVPNLIAILGPTASGKTKLAVELAYALQTEIISADSRQVYRDMNIGTGKDYSDYLIHDSKINYHLIDIADAGTEYNVNRFIDDFFEVYAKMISENKIPLLCGGTAMYFDAVLRNYEYTIVPVNVPLRNSLESKSREELLQSFKELPETPFKKIADTSTLRRLKRAIEICIWEQENTIGKIERNPISPIVFGLDPGRELRRERIAERLWARLNEGLIQEVQGLLLRGISTEKMMYYGLEYKFVTMHITGELSFEEMQTELTKEIQRFAKRQMTFFRKMEREGLKIIWIDASQPVDFQFNFAMKSLQIAGIHS